MKEAPTRRRLLALVVSFLMVFTTLSPVAVFAEEYVGYPGDTAVYDQYGEYGGYGQYYGYDQYEEYDGKEYPYYEEDECPYYGMGYPNCDVDDNPYCDYEEGYIHCEDDYAYYECEYPGYDGDYTYGDEEYPCFECWNWGWDFDLDLGRPLYIPIMPLSGGTVVFDLSNPAHTTPNVQGMTPGGAQFAGATPLQNAGTNLFPVAHPVAGISVHVDGRAGGWSGLDIQTGSIFTSSTANYVVAISGRVVGPPPPNAQVTLEMEEAPWTPFANSGYVLGTDAPFTITHTFTTADIASLPTAAIRIRSNAAGANMDFIIDEIVITREGLPTLPTRPTTPANHEIAFEMLGTTGWFSTNPTGVTDGGHFSLDGGSVTGTVVAGSATNHPHIAIAGRTQNFHGLNLLNLQEGDLVWVAARSAGATPPGWWRIDLGTANGTDFATSASNPTGIVGFITASPLTTVQAAEARLTVNQWAIADLMIYDIVIFRPTACAACTLNPSECHLLTAAVAQNLLEYVMGRVAASTNFQTGFEWPFNADEADVVSNITTVIEGINIAAIATRLGTIPTGTLPVAVRDRLVDYLQTSIDINNAGDLITVAHSLTLNTNTPPTVSTITGTYTLQIAPAHLRSALTVAETRVSPSLTLLLENPPESPAEILAAAVVDVQAASFTDADNDMTVAAAWTQLRAEIVTLLQGTPLYDDITLNTAASMVSRAEATDSAAGHITFNVTLSIPNPSQVPNPLSTTVAITVDIPQLPPQPEVLWQLSQYAPVQGLGIGASATTTNLLQSGSATITAVAHPTAGRSISVTNRGQAHYALDVTLPAEMRAWNTYEVEVTVRTTTAVAGAQLLLQEISGGWQVFASADASAPGTFVLTSALTGPDLAAAMPRFRVGSNGAGASMNFFIDAIIITRTVVGIPDPCPGNCGCLRDCIFYPCNCALPLGPVFVLSDHLDSTMVGNTDLASVPFGIAGLQRSGSGDQPLLTIVNVNGEPALQVANRAQTWHSVDIRYAAAGMAPLFYNYRITVLGTAPGVNMRFGPVDAPWGAPPLALGVGTPMFSLRAYVGPQEASSPAYAAGVRIQSTCLANFIIHEIIIERISDDERPVRQPQIPVPPGGVFPGVGGGPAPPAPTAPRPEPTAPVAVREPIFNLRIDGLPGTATMADLPFLSAASDDYSISLVGTGANRRVRVYERSAGWHGLNISNIINPTMRAGDTLRIEGQLGSNVPSEWFTMHLNSNLGGWSDIASTGNLAGQAGATFVLEHTLTAADLSGIRVQSNHYNDQHLPIHDFYIDNIILFRTTAAEEFNKYSLVDDAYVQGASGASDLYGTPYLSIDGVDSGVAVTVRTREGGTNYLHITGRSENFHGINIHHEAVGFQVGDIVRVSGRTGANWPESWNYMLFNANMAGWAPRGNVGANDLGPNQTFTMTYQITNADMNLINQHGGMRIMSNAGEGLARNMDFFIYSITVSAVRAADSDDDPTPPAAAAAETVVRYEMLQDNYVQGLGAGVTDLYGTPYLTISGDPVVNIGILAGNRYLHVTGRTEDWHGIDIGFPDVAFAAGDTVRVTGRLGNTVPDDWAALILNLNPGGWDESYQSHDVRNIGPGGEFVMEIVLTQAQVNMLMAANPPGIRIQANTGGSPENNASLDFIIDNIEVVHYVVGAPPAPLADGVMRFVIGSTTFTHGGATHTVEAAPFIQDGRAMLPLRAIGEAMGAEFDFVNNVVYMDKNDIELRMAIGVALPDDKGTPVIVSGRTFVPVRYVVEMLGAEVDWEQGAEFAIYVILP